MDLIQAAATPGHHLRRHLKIRSTDVDHVADDCLPLAHWPPYWIRDPTSFKAWQIDPLIVQELLASSVATAEEARLVAMGLVVPACDVAGPGPCDAKRLS